MEQIEMTQIDVSITRDGLWPDFKDKTALALLQDRFAEAAVPLPLVRSDGVRLTAVARARHVLVRAVRDYLDREGFLDTFGPPPSDMVALLGRVYWADATAKSLSCLSGVSHGAELVEMIDLLERMLVHVLQEILGRSRADLNTLGIDCDMLKYVRLPVRRVPLEAALEILGYPDGSLTPEHEEALLHQCGEPILLGFYPDAERLSAWCLILPHAGRIASITPSGSFSVDIERLSYFILQPRFANFSNHS